MTFHIAFGAGLLAALILIGGALLYLGMNAKTENEDGPVAYVCDVCGTGSESEQEAKEHAMSHSAIDELSWPDVVSEVN